MACIIYITNVMRRVSTVVILKLTSDTDNPTALVAGNVHWGHATSEDLYSWTNQPIAIFPGGPDEGSTYSNYKKYVSFYWHHLGVIQQFRTTKIDD